MRLFLTYLTCIMRAAADVATLPTEYATAYMDRRNRDQLQYGCGDTIRDTLSGEISSVIPADSPGLNCSLTLYSPPGTRLSLTITHIMLVSHNPNTCDGNRLKIIGSDDPGDASLIPSFPNGLCGYVRPSQSVDTEDNRVHLLLESVLSMENQIEFNLSYTSFKTTVDDECFACDVGDSRSTPFCIDQRLLCDTRKNCPGNSEETNANCMVTLTPPSGSGNVVVIVITCLLAVLLIAIIIIVVLAVMAKRAHSKRNRGSSAHHLSGRSSQSRMMPPSPGLAVDLDDRRHHATFTDTPEPYDPSPGPPSLLHRSGPPTFTVDGEFYNRLSPDTAGPLPRAPPPYATLPRPMEQSLEMADNTNPTSRSRLPSADNEVDPGTP